MTQAARSVVVAVGLFAALAIVHTWPLASAPGRLSLNHNSDAELNEWIVSWIAHTLPRHPTRLFDGNIFAPERDTLAYSDPLIVPALAGAPIRWLGGSPVLTFNLLLIAGLTLTAMSAWFVAWRWTGSARAAWVAGALAAFNVHLLTRLPHLQAAHAWGLPLAWYFADKLADRPNKRDGIWLAIVLAAIAATSLYWLVFTGLLLVVIALTSGRPRAVLAIAAAGVAGLVVASPVLLPYVRLAAAGTTRPLEVVSQFSATPAGYLVSTSRLYSALTMGLRTTDVNVMFPGLGAVALGVLGLIAGSKSRASRRRIVAFVLVGIAGIVLSFGPSTALYRWLYQWAVPLRGIRAAARFGYLFLLVLAFAAACGVASIERRTTSRRVRLWIAPLAVLLVTVEVWQGPVRTVPFTGVPRIYTLLTDAERPVRLVEVPFYLPDTIFENGEYVLNSTAHWQPLLNGYSGFTPDSYRERADTLWLFPAEFAMQTIHRDGVTHVMVHLSGFGNEAKKIAQEIDQRADLRLIAADRNGLRLYEVVR